MSLKVDLNSLANLDFSPFTDAEIMAHFNGRCQACGSTYQVANHHLIFRSQGGTHSPRIPLCNTCHSRLHGNPEFRKKYEAKLLKIAGVFYQLQTQGLLF
jgi:5-methylcytosine-specific restriction endonuclease McrA